MSAAPNFKQELTGVFGHPVAENPSQAMVEAAYRHHGLDWRYLTLEVRPDDLAAAVAGARAMGFAGFNCTIPHKVAVIEHLDGLGESAALMGAVNCVVRRGDQLIGENTDGKGFVTSLRELTDPAGKHLVLFGSGGNRYDRGPLQAFAIEETVPDAKAQLYDLLEDPGETKNLVLERPEQAARLKGMLDALVLAGRSAPQR